LYPQEIKKYYVQIMTEASDLDLAIKEREANTRPKEASFYKKELNDWVVALKLFKEEIDAYDKVEQEKKGAHNNIKYRTGHAREWFNNMSASQLKQVQDAKEKWNKEGAPGESQAT